MSHKTIIVYHKKSSERAALQNSATPVSTVSPANFERRLRTGLEGILPQQSMKKIRSMAKVKTG